MSGVGAAGDAGWQEARKVRRKRKERRREDLDLFIVIL
jgi:hypothetical protein